MHVTRLKVFKVEGFDRPYPTTHMRRQVQKWEAEELEDVNMDELDMTEEMPPGTKGPKPPAGGEADKAEKDRRTKVGAETKREGAGDAEPGKPAERGKRYEREGQAEREAGGCKIARSKMVAGHGTVPDPKEKDGEESSVGPSSQSSGEGYSPSSRVAETCVTH